MKNVLMVLLMGFVAASYGAVSIDWKASAGFYFTVDPNVGILGDATGNSTYAQLMYSADMTQDAGNAVTGIGLNGNGTGDDIYWSRVTLTEDGVSGNFDDFAAFSSFEGRPWVSGYVYALIFQDNNYGGNDWYFYTPMVPLVNVALGDGNQTIEMNNDLVNGDAIDSGMTVAQSIPEPATFLLFGMGGAGAWILRRRQQA